ncbi:uncharacterized protein LOC104900325 [Beta vulgaris subsp. vulgaris]|uniref:uncharacterized protein LOC104900325 n=1 Tax=Beta vulgaris subsp. vulgaris TaxID=3555 RepID=UPI0020370785|nr:uncharacterized protein LOC104900325 [Beta vulgaris subsp. vulgaris]
MARKKKASASASREMTSSSINTHEPVINNDITPQHVAKGTSLKFIAPTVKNGGSIASLDKNETDKLSEIWATSLVIYIVGVTPSIGALTRFIEKEWNTVAKPTIYLHDDGFFVVKFGSVDDRNEILYVGPHSYNNRPIIVKPWTANFNFNEEVLKVIPLWIKLPNLPLNCWSADSLSRIGSLLGVPLYANECTSKQLRISFARILVEIDVTKDIQYQVHFEDANGVVIKQQVKYD